MKIVQTDKGHSASTEKLTPDYHFHYPDILSTQQQSTPKSKI